MPIPKPAVPAGVPWALEMKAVSMVEPMQLVRTLTGAILGCGGWVLSRGSSDTGRVTLLFEFERQSCVEMYSLMIASGIELSQSAHIRMTELCHCTSYQQNECSLEIASIDLEVQTYPIQATGYMPPTPTEAPPGGLL